MRLATLGKDQIHNTIFTQYSCHKENKRALETWNPKQIYRSLSLGGRDHIPTLSISFNFITHPKKASSIFILGRFFSIRGSKMTTLCESFRNHKMLENPKIIAAF